MPCPYADIFGKPGEGPHATRFAGLAVVDTVLTILIAVLTAWWLQQPFWAHFVFWFVLGEVLHYAFGANTAFLRMIGVPPIC